MATIEIAETLEEYLALPTDNERCKFLYYYAYGTLLDNPPQYYSAELDMKDLERHLWSRRNAVARKYIHKLGGLLSNRIYRSAVDQDDSTAIAISFYFSLLHATLIDRCTCLAETIFADREDSDSDSE
jgi:hypothetical protein